jgi:hypothetical protein
MKRILILLSVLFLGCTQTIPEPVVHHHQNSKLPVWHPEYKTTFVEEYDAGAPEEEDELEGVQCPIPMSCRVRNYTGVQCVFSSTEMLARWAECKELLEPEPITSRSGCKSYSGPSDLRSKLERFGVKRYTEGGSGPMYKDAYRDRAKAVALIKEAMEEGRGALFGVPGHAMVLIHYDEATDTVKWVDNSDRSLRVQTMTISRFNKRWDGWVCVIYADPDIVPYKVGNWANKIPIIDHNNPQGEYPKDYIPMPSK